jgi:hypothetical protein
MGSVGTRREEAESGLEEGWCRAFGSWSITFERWERGVRVVGAGFEEVGSI